MRKKLFILLSLITIFIVTSTLIIVKFHKRGALKYKPGTSEIIGENEEGEEQGIEDAIKYLALLKNNQVTGELSSTDVYKAMDQILNLPHTKANSVKWKEMGPDNVGGRTRAILFDIRDPKLQTIYAGGVSGGLWKTTTGGSSWFPVSLSQIDGDKFGNFENINISSIAQGPDSTIYIGTGERLATASGTGTIGTTGFVGNGIYYLVKNKKNSDSFAYLTSTKGVANFDFVNKLVVNPNNGWIFAATGAGLMVSKDKGATWAFALKVGSSTVKGLCMDVKLASDQSIITGNTTTATDGKRTTVTYLSTDGGSTFVKKSGLVSDNAGRIEYAFAPSNPNYIYAQICKTDGHLLGVYRSTDKGNNWTLIGPGDSYVFVMFGSGTTGQGVYDNIIAVFPDNPNRILCGGVTLYEWEEGKTWLDKTNGVSYPIHADLHSIVFHPKNPKIYYIGCDGGVYRTKDAGETYEEINLNYNVTQFYALAISGLDEVMGGTQDNGTPYISHHYNTDRGAIQVGGGDGGWCSFSLINPNALFVSLYYSTVLRNSDKTTGLGWQAPTDWYGGNFKNKWGMLANGIDSNGDGTPDNYGDIFVTQLLLWETFNDNFSKELVTYKADKNYKSGDIVVARSKNNSFQFKYKLPVALDKDSSIKITDKIQSRFFLSMHSALYGNNIWMTKGAVDFSRTPQWYRIAGTNNIPNSSGQLCTMAISKDGNNLFVATTGGFIYRISNLRYAYDSLTADVSSKYRVISVDSIKRFSGRVVTSISVDPQNSAHLIVTLGQYGNTNYIYECKNALDKKPTFASKQGSGTTALPLMPVYASLIEMSNSKMVFVGTEFGIFKTSDISAANPVWVEENFGMDRVPTFMLRQQIYRYDGDFAPTGSIITPFDVVSKTNNVKNYGVIYAATHGRGIFKTEDYALPVGINENSINESKPELNVYPNPVRDNLNITFNLIKPSAVVITLYDMNGRKVKNVNLEYKPSGQNKTSIDVRDLPKGTYIISLTADHETSSAKVIVTK